MANEPSQPGKKSFHRHVERALKKGGVLHIHYKKMNGRTVKRKIEPHSMRGNTLVAYDHKRKAIRSFRMERVKHMEKAAGKITAHETSRDALRMSLLHGASLGLVGRMLSGPGGGWVPAVAGAGGGLLAGAVGSAIKQKLRKDPEAEKTAFWQGFEKEAGAGAELAGLGMLAVPSIQHLRGKPMKEKTTHALELAGLGTLAAPYAASVAKGAYSKAKPLLSRVLKRA